MSALNPAQQRAVDHPHGPLLVLAGAGSGKTRVITQRIAALVHRGVRPESLCALSFTNKAAEELGQRMARLLPSQQAKGLWLSTFHRLGLAFLQEEAKSIWGFARFVVFDQGDGLGVVRDILRRLREGERRLDAASIAARISLWKGSLLTPGQVQGRLLAAADEYDEVAAEVYAPYEESLRSMQAVDFEDLVTVPVHALRADPLRRERWQNRFSHLLIDEFQDTNHSQFELMKLLVGPLRNVCVVGDDDQSIYGWRGAQVGNLAAFEDTFAGTTVVKLEENYRSYAPIVAVANAVVQQGAARRHRKTLRAMRGEGEAVSLVKVTDPAAEAQAVASEVRRLRERGVALRDIAVLYRSNQQARLVEEEMRLAGLPYQLLGGTQVFDRKEVKDALAYLRAALNPRDDLALRRIVNVPARGVGPAAVQRLAGFALVHEMSFFDALAQAERVSGLGAAAQRGASHLVAILRQGRVGLRQQSGYARAARELVERSGLYDSFDRDASSASVERRRENLNRLLQTVERFEEQKGEGDENCSFEQLLARLSLRWQPGTEQSQQRATLATLHAVKGLEFGVVFLIGCVEGQLPHARSLDPKITDAAPTAVDEERRLFYVGVTRARDRLILMVPRQRSLRGRTVPLVPSRFLEGLPAEALRAEELRDQSLEYDEVAQMANAILQKLG